MGRISDVFADRFTSGQVRMDRAGVGIANRVINSTLIPLRDELAEKIRVADLAGVSGSEQVRRWQDLLKRVKSSIASAYSSAETGMKRELLELADIAQTQTVNISNAVIGADIIRPTMTRATLKALTDPATQLIHGNPAADWWAKQSTELQTKFKQQINLGMAAGETNDQLVQRIRGKQIGYREISIKGKARKVPMFSGGIMQASTRDAKALVRTAVAQVSNEVNYRTFEGNRDVLRGVQAQVTLDNRTTPICIGRSGGAWDFDGEPLPESTVKSRFPGPPPWHFNCRSLLIPITKTWSELVESKTGKKLKISETVPISKQSSMDGQVAGDLTYEGWLKTKPEAFQRDTLGPGKFELWKEGKIGLTQLIDQSGNPLTLKELRKLAGAPLKEVLPPAPPTKSFVEEFQAWSSGLSMEEEKAFKYWTSKGYADMRAVQKGISRRLDPRADAIAREHVAKMNAALDRAPKFSGEIWRGISRSRNPNFLRDIRKPGTILDQNAFTSWSESSHIAGSFADDDNDVDGGAVMMVLRTASGIQNPRGDHQEREVVMRPGTRFQVVEVVKRNHWRYGQILKYAPTEIVNLAATADKATIVARLRSLDLEALPMYDAQQGYAGVSSRPSPERFKQLIDDFEKNGISSQVDTIVLKEI